MPVYNLRDEGSDHHFFPLPPFFQILTPNHPISDAGNSQNFWRTHLKISRIIAGRFFYGFPPLHGFLLMDHLNRFVFFFFSFSLYLSQLQRMNNCVPDFEEMEENDSFPSSSVFSRQKKSTMADDELVELLWQNGQVVMQRQNQRSQKKSPSPSPAKFPAEDAVLPGRPESSGVIAVDSATETGSSSAAAANQLFIQEDEMASWLHYSLDDTFERDFCADLLYPAPSGNYAPVGRNSQVPAEPRSPVPPGSGTEAELSAAKLVNFKHFSRPKSKVDSRPSDEPVGESTVVDSNVTPEVGSGNYGSFVRRSGTSQSETAAPISGENLGRGSTYADSERELGTCEPAVTSSSGGSGASADRFVKPPADDRKRKAREANEFDCHSEDAEFESLDVKKASCRSASARRARAAEVHNLSERRRRDRINEKMKALQELIPHCNKSDKASMLDEAIDYLKSLQLQVQMMSMGCSMAPMMFPGVQQYMAPVGMGMGLGMGMTMGMGMGMGMDMGAARGLNRPMMPFPPVLAGSGMPGHATAHFGPRLPMPAFHVPPDPHADQTRVQAINRPDQTSNLVGLQNPFPLQTPNFVDTYHPYFDHHYPVQVPPPPQNQAAAQASSSKVVENRENKKSG